MIRVLARLVDWVAPPDASEWAEAMQAEIAAIADPRAARRFALGCLWAAVAFRLGAAIRGRARAEATRVVPGPLLFIQANCACGAAAIGVLYLIAAQAPMAMVLVNAVAVLLGVLLVIASQRLRELSSTRATGTAIVIAAVLLLTAVSGHAVDGVSRWVQLGALSVQTSLVFLPLAVLLFAHTVNTWTTVAMVAIALAVALQPDRAMAFALWAGVCALLLVRRSRPVAIAWGAASVAVLVTWLQADPLPAVPYVDLILWSSFRLHPLLGVALWLGSALLFMPMLVMRSTDARPACLATGACWAAIVAAAATGAYPTPVVGYGGAAILGYFLCLAALGAQPTEAHTPSPDTAAVPDAPARGERDADASHRHVERLRVHRVRMQHTPPAGLRA